MIDAARTPSPAGPPGGAAPRSCAFCNWNGDVGAFAHATVIHPDKDWAVVPQMGHEFVIDMALVRDAARTPSQPDLPLSSGVVCDAKWPHGPHKYGYDATCPGIVLCSHPSQPDLREALERLSAKLDG